MKTTRQLAARKHARRPRYKRRGERYDLKRQIIQYERKRRRQSVDRLYLWDAKGLLLFVKALHLETTGF